MHDNNGLVKRFKVNRPLLQFEHDNHLPQNKKTEAEPKNRRVLIRFSSTFLECCDKYLSHRGLISLASIFMIGFLTPFSFMILSVLKWKPGDEVANYATVALIIFGSLPIIVFAFIMLCRESFSYTHYPIRFNRKTRKVHVFRFDGTVMTEDWEKLYFTVAPHNIAGAHEIWGHRMSEDGLTVLETFALPYATFNKPDLYSFWEYIREYMENEATPSELSKQVDYVLDIADRKQTYMEGLRTMFEDDYDGSPLGAFIVFPITVVSCLGRSFANLTSKIPQWPKEIEDQCVIDLEDPYVIDAKTLKNSKAGKSALKEDCAA